MLPPGEAIGRDGARIVVVGDRSYPPYEFLDQDGNPSGFNVELMRAIAEAMGLEVEFRLGVWSEMRSGVEEGAFDVLQGISYSDERAKVFDFAPPHAIINHGIFARRGSPAVHSLPELRGKEVLLHKHGIMHDTLLASGMDVTLVTTETPAEALSLLASGKHDFALVAMVPAEYLIRERGLSNIVPVARRIAVQKYCYAVKKGRAELLATITEGLAIVHKNGKYRTLHQKWLGVLEDQGPPWAKMARIGAMVILPLLVLLVGTVIWSHSLQKRVAQRTEALTQEIAERKRAEEQLREHQEQLLQADKMTALGILVSGVAHEINNPNGLILLNLPALIEAYADAEPILEDHYQRNGDFLLGGLKYSRMRTEIPLMLSEMLDGAKRIKRIVEDLKDFARRDSSALVESIHLNSVVQASVRLLQNLIRKSTNHFHVEYGKDLPAVGGSSQRIEQVIVNLILNACQALGDRENGISMKTFLDGDMGMVVVEVRDQGMGIAPEDLAHLTDPFFTTKRETGGTGLGLSLSARIVKEHGGSLSFVSAPGAGTTVRLSLPVKEEKDSA